MIFNSKNTQVFIHREPVDMRKGHDGLSSIVENQMKLELLSGALFLFINKSRRLCKALYFDGTGLVIIHKRLEVGSFMSFNTFDETQKITLSELALIFEGDTLRIHKKAKSFEYGNSRRLKNKP
jgi:transposase